MTKLTKNVEAYTLLADILETLRDLIRGALAEQYGEEWEAKGLPTPPRIYLEQRRTREINENWHARKLDLLGYTGFLDLLTVIVANPHLSTAFSHLHPEEAVLRARFSEMDTVLNRIAYCRAVSDIDIDLMAGFHERLARISVPPPQGNSPTDGAPAENEAPGTEPTVPLPEEPPAPPPKPAKQAPSQADTTPSGAQSKATKTDAPADSEAQEPKTEPDRQDAATEAIKPQEPRKGTPNEKAPETPDELDAALAREDDAAVLAALYQEVVSVAENLWDEAAAIAVPVWEQVRESPWYKKRFTPLGLRPVSDFYDVVGAAQSRLKEHVSRDKLHEFLKERDLARVLLALREVFRPLVAADGSKRNPAQQEAH